jgi:NitT/TauT family transport system substrate-binding protein
MNRRELLASGAGAFAAATLSGQSARAEDVIRIEFTRFSAFYSPLIATAAGGFLEAEGLKPVFSVATPGKSALASLADGSAHVVQSAPSQAFADLEKGQRPAAVHFAQINERDGFFLAAREADPHFSWDKLKGKKVLVTPGSQPIPMFKYACFKSGLDLGAFEMVNVGETEEMIAAFRRGEADYIHLQGPAPQQLQRDGIAHVVAAVGDAIGPCAFSSLAAKREWLATDQAKAFMRAYRKARAWLIAQKPADVAQAERSFFKETDPSVLTETVATYQTSGTWSPHVEITRPAFETVVDVFQHAGLISKRYAYDDIVVSPPSA